MKDYDSQTSAKGRLPLSEYRQLMKRTPIATVDVLFFNKALTKTLLFKRLNKPLQGAFFSMGGRLRKNEMLQDGAARQAYQETGLRLKKNKLVLGGVQDEAFKESIFPGVGYHAVDTFYGYILDTDTTVRLDGQHKESKWFSVSDTKLHPLLKTKLRATIAAMKRA